MTDPDPGSSHAFANSGRTNLTYRCVCGVAIPLQEGGGETCPHCGRHYDSDVLHDAGGETVFMPAQSGDETDHSERESNADSLIGGHLQHFRILDRIGGGGMGAVYRALDESLQRYVALKVIQHQAASAKNDLVQRLFQEARAQARVNHPHVAHIYYVGTDKETPFLAMELVGTHTMAHRLKYGPLTFPEVAGIALQIAEALAHAARFDIVHGDVKPGNILLVDHKTVKISDFGLARRMSEMTTDSSVAAGTPNYMSPEATQGITPDHRSDMYSLGVTLFEMTFGRLPYTCDSTDLHERLRLHREAAIEFPEQWPAELPEAWRDVLEKLLAKNPADRYADFKQLVADLRKLQPVELPTARPVLRWLAWTFDGFLLSSPIVMLSFMLPVDGRPLVQLSGALLAALIPLGAAYLQAWWGTTPGKKLFQIRIVDMHGLHPRKSALGLRSAFQFLWVWNLVVQNLLHFFGLIDLAFAVLVLVFLFILAEMGFAVLGKGRSLHDRFFGTRVVLDAIQPKAT